MSGSHSQHERAYLLQLTKKEESLLQIREKKVNSFSKTDRPRQTVEKQEIPVYPSVGKKPPCSMYGKKILTIPFCLFKRWRKEYAQEQKMELTPTFTKKNLIPPQP